MCVHSSEVSSTKEVLYVCIIGLVCHRLSTSTHSYTQHTYIISALNVGRQEANVGIVCMYSTNCYYSRPCDQNMACLVLCVSERNGISILQTTQPSITHKFFECLLSPPGDRKLTRYFYSFSSDVVHRLPQ